jgi:hypothetical protein
MAEERRRNGLRQKLDKLHDSRQLYDALQAKNHELYVILHVDFFRIFILFK